MKILFIIDCLRIGGKERQFVELVKEFNKKPSIQINIIFLKNVIEYPKFKKLNIKCHVVPQNCFKAIFKIISLCRVFKPNIIHSWCKLCTLYSIPAAKSLKIKLIDGSIRYAAPIKQLSKSHVLSELNFYFSEIVISNSRAGLITHKKVPNTKYRVIHNGININRVVIKPNKKKLKQNINFPYNYCIGMVANFSPSKDHFTFLDACKNVLKRRNDLGILFIGDGPNRKLVENQIPKNYKSHFFFLGKIENIYNILPILDIGVLLTNTNGHAEGISNAIMEMMAIGVPIIATNAGGNPEIIENKKNGFLVHPFNEFEIVKCIELLLNNKELRFQLGYNNINKITSLFSYEKMIKKYLIIYNELVS